MTVLKVPGMHCEMCVKRIDKALSEADLKFEISLENHTVSIDGDAAAVKTTISKLDDLGFEAAE